MIAVGISGSYAVGKTFVLDYLASLGHKTFSADMVVNELYSNRQVRDKVLKLLFPLKIFDRKEIARLIYTNLCMRKTLQNFIHPIVVTELKKFKIRNEKEAMIFAEIPLLFEQNFAQYFDFTVAIYCSEKLRLERAKMRENFDYEIYSRIAEIQLEQEEKIKKADFAINTDSNPAILSRQINELIRQLK